MCLRNNLREKTSEDRCRQEAVPTILNKTFNRWVSNTQRLDKLRTKCKEMCVWYIIYLFNQCFLAITHIIRTPVSFPSKWCHICRNKHLQDKQKSWECGLQRLAKSSLPMTNSLLLFSVFYTVAIKSCFGWLTPECQHQVVALFGESPRSICKLKAKLHVTGKSETDCEEGFPRRLLLHPVST